MAPGVAVRCRGRRARVGALVACRGAVCALTVAHLFGRRPAAASLGDGSGIPGRLVVRVPLHRRHPHPGDAALVALPWDVPFRPDPEPGPLLGHLAVPVVGADVALTTAAGVRRGVVVAYPWSGVVRYPWGRRRLVGQALVALLDGPPPGRGASGLLWTTPDNLAAGLQVARLGDAAVVTPLGELLAAWQGRLIRRRRRLR